MAGGGIVAVSVPFIRSLSPGDHLKPPHLDVDISKLKEGQVLSVAFNQRPLYVVKRSESVIEQLKSGHPDLRDPHSLHSDQPQEAANFHRSLRTDVFVSYGICTHLGCSVSYNAPGLNEVLGERFENGNFFCPCHGAVYDLAGRVFKNVPAERNLDIPPYEFIEDAVIRIHDPRGL